MISIIIPTYNESKTIISTVLILHHYMQENSIEHEVIVADNGSTDSTVRKVHHTALNNKWLKLVYIHHKAPGTAFMRAVWVAKGELIIQLDADLSVGPEFIGEAVKSFKRYEWDMLVGSKLRGSQKRNWIRVFGSWLYIALVQRLFGLHLSDFSIGAKAYRREAILGALPHIDSWTGYPLELCLYLKSQGKRVSEKSVKCIDTRRSHFNLANEAVRKYLHLYRTYRLWRGSEEYPCQSIDYSECEGRQ